MRTRIALGLSREVWLIEIGIFLNLLGYGAVLPFEVIYLHDGRGFGLRTAGLVVGTLTGVAAISAPIAGSLIDRCGARTTASVAGIALAIGYGGLALAHTPATAFIAAGIAGAGNGALIPSQSTLLASLAPRELRHRAAAVSRAAGNAGMGVGGAIGGLVAAHGLPGYVALYLLNAVTYLLYIVVLIVAVRSYARIEAASGGYRRVLGDRTFLRLALINAAMIGVGWGVLPWVIPPYAHNDLGMSTQAIGLLLLANAATVVVAQVPIAALAEGRRRVVMFALASAAFGSAFLLALAASHLTEAAAWPALIIAAIAIGVGECFYSTALMPLVADLAPAGLRGRYMATIGLSWWVGLALAPTLGTQLLSVSPQATFLAAAGVAAAAGVSALALEPALPATSRLTPRPQ